MARMPRHAQAEHGFHAPAVSALPGAALSFQTSACKLKWNAQPALGLDDITELTGLSAPIETAAAQQVRKQDIITHADSLVYSTMHMKLGLSEGTLTVRQVSECSGAECQLLDPTTGETETAGLDAAMVGLGDAEAIGSAYCITLMSRSRSQMGVDVTSLGAWMEHGSFALNGVRAVGEVVESDSLHTVALGDLADRPLTGSATWLGVMVGTPNVGDDRGDRLGGHGGFELRHGHRRAQCQVQRHQEHRPRDGAWRRDGDLH
ncbi:MAG: hypothetical protein OXL68_01400 [Paracoccaceae bacterium]|nr:hypothetical protein [Paracoccaceae bacterium]